MPIPNNLLVDPFHAIQQVIQCVSPVCKLLGMIFNSTKREFSFFEDIIFRLSSPLLIHIRSHLNISIKMLCQTKGLLLSVIAKKNPFH
jgi:hypothetical protein